MNGPIPEMYSLKPIIHFSEDIVLPNNMYKMKSIYSNFNEPKLDNIEQNENLFQEVSNPEIEEIESRQSLILQQLKELQNQMDQLRKQLQSSSSSASSLKENKSANSPVKTILHKPNFSENGIIRDVVINADPKYPPYSLLGVSKVWPGIVNVNISSYIHSSAINVPNDTISYFTSQFSDHKVSDDIPTLNVTLIWKDIGQDCEFIVSPINHYTVNGEVNILRYLHRQINPDGDILEETQLDEFLDSCYCLIHTNNKKDKSSIIRKMNATLGKSEWFFGNTISVCDLAAWSSFRNVEDLELTQKMSKWLEQCNQLMGVKP